MIDNIALYDPTKTMKFAMSSNNLLESTNVIYAYCDFTHLYNEIAKLTNWRKWEQYVIIGGRIGGTFMTDFGKYKGALRREKKLETATTWVSAQARSSPCSSTQFFEQLLQQQRRKNFDIHCTENVSLASST